MHWHKRLFTSGNAPVITFFVIAAFMRLYMLSSVPGLHFDEARYGNNAVDIIKGRINPLVGQKPYNGNFNLYVLATGFLLDGYVGVFSLRFLHAFFNTVGLALVYLAVREYDRDAALFTLGILSVMPYHLIFSRVAWEFFLTPFLLSLCFYLFVKYLKHGKGVFLILFFFAAGLCLQTQMGSVIPLSALFACLLLCRFKSLFGWHALAGVFVFFLALYPILLNEYSVHSLSQGVAKKSGKHSVLDMGWVAGKYRHYFWELGGVLDGRLAYLRTVGSVLSEPYAVNSTLVWLSVAWLPISFLWFRDDLRKFTIIYMAVSLLAAPYFFMMFGARTYPLRYFTYFFPIGLLSAGMLLGDIHRKCRLLGIALLLFVVVSNAYFVWENFFQGFSLTEGSLNRFYIGFYEQSHFPAVTANLAGVMQGRDVRYFRGPYLFDLQAVVRFYSQQSASSYEALGDLKDDFDDGALYFTVDLDGRNDSLAKFNKVRKRSMYVKKTLEFKNTLNETKMRVYVLGQKND